MKALAAGKIENIFHDFTAGLAHCFFFRLQISGVKNDERVVSANSRVASETSIEVAVIEGDVVRSPILKSKAEDLTVKRLGRSDVRGGEFDVVNSVFLLMAWHIFSHFMCGVGTRWACARDSSIHALASRGAQVESPSLETAEVRQKLTEPALLGQVVVSQAVRESTRCLQAHFECGARWVVDDGVEFAGTQIHTSLFFAVEGARAATSEDGELIAALIDRTITVNPF